MPRFLLIAAQLTASALAVACTVWSRLGGMFAPWSGALDAAAVASLGAVVVLTPIGLVAARGRGGRARIGVVATAVALTLAAGLAGPLVDAAMRRSVDAARAAERGRIETALASRLGFYAKDIDARIAARRPYAPAEALDLLDVVAGSDLSRFGLADRSQEAFALVRRALEAKLVDPNGLVKGPRPVDREPVPLFLFYYQFNIEPVRAHDVPDRHWRLLMLLVDHGAEIGAAGAERLAAELAAVRSKAASRP